MIERMRRAALGAGLAAGWLAALLVGVAWAQERPSAEDLPREAIEAIVRDYLLREPEVIYEALQELQRRQAAAEDERRQVALATHRDQLFAHPDSPVAGNPEGDVTMVEFFDYRCTYCRRVVPSVQALLEVDEGLKLVFKELPVLGEDSVRAARAALASREQDRYQAFHFALMQATDLSQGGIMRLASELGMDAEQLARDMQAPKVQAEIDANYRLASELGIEGTPAFVIGDQLIPGAIDQGRMQELIEQARTG